MVGETQIQQAIITGKTTNLTIVFNKPIIVPKIVINNENRTISLWQRALEESNNKQDDDDEEAEMLNYWSIEEVI